MTLRELISCLKTPTLDKILTEDQILDLDVELFTGPGKHEGPFYLLSVYLLNKKTLAVDIGK
jgi:hypothetical protein